MTTMAFGHWFAGFVDGEGSFLINRRVVAGYIVYDCSFAIRLRADDRAVLEEIQREVGVGTVRNVSPDKRGRSAPCAIFSVGSKAGCTVVREVLEAHPLRAKKARDFRTWSNALDAWIGHKWGKGWDEVAELRELLMRGRSYDMAAMRP